MVQFFKQVFSVRSFSVFCRFKKSERTYIVQT